MRLHFLNDGGSVVLGRLADQAHCRPVVYQLEVVRGEHIAPPPSATPVEEGFFLVVDGLTITLREGRSIEAKMLVILGESVFHCIVRLRWTGPPKTRGKGKTQLDRIFVFDREQDAAADAGANRGLAKRISLPPIAALGDG